MSRIHEALKKAASERITRLAEGTSPELIELVEEGAARATASAAVTEEASKKAAGFAVSTPPQYEELLRKCRDAEWKIDPRHSVFVNESLEPGGAERFRTLRSRLYQIASTRPLKRILISSSVPEEGKTFIASNLAQSMIRQENRRVLLIDADLRASRLHRALGVAVSPGLSDYLRGDADECQIVQVGPEKNLCLIAGGAEVSNPSELLHSKAMETLLDRLSPLFDWVILDSPPAIAVHDASLLADLCDGVLLVVRAGATDFEVAQKAAKEFDEKRMLGVVLNRAEKGEGYSYYYSRQGDREAE